MSTGVLILISLALVALSAFFVAVEFSLISAKRHRFEEQASTSAAARAALRNSSELTLLLAGSQLGITACTLGLGALSKPAVHHALVPLLDGWGFGPTLADVAAFILALFIVTFIHLVVGEMMPKSWAIAHPEKSAMMLALPMRGFMVVTRPILKVLNGFANWLLHRVGVEPQDEVANSQDAQGLRELVEHSVQTGSLDPTRQNQIEGALALSEMRLADLVRPRTHVTSVPVGARVADVWQAARQARHLRVLVGTRENFVGAVHVRDTVMRDAEAGIDDLIYDIARFDASVPVARAMQEMRQQRNHLAIVTRDGAFCGLVSFSDMLKALFPDGHVEPGPVEHAGSSEV